MNLGPQDGRRRRNHGAISCFLICVSFYLNPIVLFSYIDASTTDPYLFCSHICLPPNVFGFSSSQNEINFLPLKLSFLFPYFYQIIFPLPNFLIIALHHFVYLSFLFSIFLSIYFSILSYFYLSGALFFFSLSFRCFIHFLYSLSLSLSLFPFLSLCIVLSSAMIHLLEL